MINRNRRKELLLDIMSDPNFLQKQIFLPDAYSSEKTFSTQLDNDFMFQDKFCVRMETLNFVINPERIKGFKIEKDDFGRTIKIKTYIYVQEWFDDFQKIEIIKVYFFDNKGNILKNCFDYDVQYLDFKLECDYKFRDYLTPVFTYQIIGT